MKLEKVIYLGSLFDLYGEMLTAKQQQIFKCYYFDDISLSEIAQINKITKQAVKDCLDKTEKLLLNFEQKLKFNSKLTEQEKLLKNNPVLLEKIKHIWKENWFVSI